MAKMVHFILVLAAAMSLFTAEALAQGETTSAILGQVTDSTSAVVPGATVMVSIMRRTETRTAKTDEAGRFNFPQLNPGTYSVRVEAQVSSRSKTTTSSAGLGQKQTVDFTLKVARSNQTVEVTGEAPLINPENANTSTTLNAQPWKICPIPAAI